MGTIWLDFGISRLGGCRIVRLNLGYPKLEVGNYSVVFEIYRFVAQVELESRKYRMYSISNDLWARPLYKLEAGYPVLVQFFGEEL